MSSANIFETNFRLPPKVCILGPGPKGRDYYEKIPPEFYVIAISKAALIPLAKAPQIWMMNHVSQDWYAEASAKFKGMRVFGHDAAMKAEQLQSDLHIYYFKAPVERLTEERLLSIDGVIRYGGTVAGCAIQFAYNFGASEILLCGIDMSEAGYWDGTFNYHPDHVEVWPAVQRLNPLIKWMVAEKSLSVSSLSPTKLDVPQYENVTGPTV